MTKVVPFPQLLFAPDFLREVKDRAQFSHEVVITDHAKERMMEREISFRQVLNVLRKGEVISNPIWDAAHASYTAKMAYVCAGANIEVVCAIRGSSVQVVILTTY